MKLISLRAALTDESYLGGQLQGDSWLPWRVLLLAIVGEPLEPDELAIFQELTGRAASPQAPVREAALVIGRRGGKTRAAAVLAAYLASCVDYRHLLAPGERATLPVLAQTTDQARAAFNFALGALEASPMLRDLVCNVTRDTIELMTRVDIVVRAASFRGVRGATNIAAIADECAFWRTDESANPDVEIIRALRPSLLHTKGPIIAMSSPYARRGHLWTIYSRHFGANGDEAILVAQAPTLTMNALADPKWISQQFEEDPVAAEAEYNAQFRTDVEAFVALEAVEACVVRGRFENPPLSSVHYSAFVDPSGGIGDSFTLAIGHREGDAIIIDCIREARPPFSPESVVAEYAETLRSYRVSRVTGDRYAGEWPREQFAKHGIRYEVSEKPKSDLYRDLLPALNSRRVELLDNQKLIRQLCSLERRTARGGKDSIDHAPHARDDIANAVAGCAALLSQRTRPIVVCDAVLAAAMRPDAVDRPIASFFR
jgi:hypothetical protein